jgi:hypothetical protein
MVAALAADAAIPADIDVFACSHTLARLCRAAQGKVSPFRMLAYKLHNTLFLVRHENSPTDSFLDTVLYGHAFARATTAWERDVRESASHQRLIRYSFGGLNLVVRFEADGYVDSPAEALLDIPSRDPHSSGHANLLAALSPPNLIAASGGGPLTPHAHLLDLISRPRSKIRLRNDADLAHVSLLTRDFSDALPDLWLTQMPTAVLAIHRHGLFYPDATKTLDVRNDVAAWEHESESALVTFAAMLHWLKKVVPEEGVEVCRAGRNKALFELRKIASVDGGLASDVVKDRWGRLARGELLAPRTKAGERGGAETRE